METCRAIKKNGYRCGASHGLSRSGYCDRHNPKHFCRGLNHDGVPCGALRKDGYGYCCAAHDPSLYFLPSSIFGRDHLRVEKLDQVLEYYDYRDLYREKEVRNLSAYQLDHILELQCFAFVTVQADITDDDDQEWVADIIRDEIANRTKNLCITRSETNRMKDRACFRFLDDYITGHRERGDGLNLICTSGRKLLMVNDSAVPRPQTIRHAMGSKVKFSQRKLANEGDSPELERISYELQRLYVDMDLHVPSKE